VIDAAAPVLVPLMLLFVAMVVLTGGYFVGFGSGRDGEGGDVTVDRVCWHKVQRGGRARLVSLELVNSFSQARKQISHAKWHVTVEPSSPHAYLSLVPKRWPIGMQCGPSERGGWCQSNDDAGRVGRVFLSKG
jgi:hypothetical protein